MQKKCAKRYIPNYSTVPQAYLVLSRNAFEELFKYCFKYQPFLDNSVNGYQTSLVTQSQLIGIHRSHPGFVGRATLGLSVVCRSPCCTTRRSYHSRTGDLPALPWPQQWKVLTQTKSSIDTTYLGFKLFEILFDLD